MTNSQFSIAELLLMGMMSADEIQHDMKEDILAVVGKVKSEYKRFGDLASAIYTLGELNVYTDGKETKSLHQWLEDDNIEADMEDGFSTVGATFLGYKNSGFLKIEKMYMSGGAPEKMIKESLES